MANAEHLEILNSGVERWNEWRRKNMHVFVDLSRGDVRVANLCGANLFRTNLRGTYFHKANLSNAYLPGADMSEAVLSGVNLSGADLVEASLRGASLIGADLSGANLWGVDLSGANLSEANLSGAALSRANFTKSTIENTALTGCKLHQTTFGLTNLSTCKGLESVQVSSPCIIDFQTLWESKNLPKEFLTKLGIPDLLIEYLPDFYNPALMIYPAFLSHSRGDKEFVRKLYEALTKKGVTVWLDEKKMKPGDIIYDSIADAIKHYDKLILVCSENALKSWWVEKELERVYEKERQMQKQHGKKFRLVIPIRIDDQILSTEGDIFDTLRNSMIGDFTAWRDDSKFEKAVKDLVDALNASRPDIKPPSLLNNL